MSRKPGATKQMSVWLTPEQHVALKVEAARRGTSVSCIVREVADRIIAEAAGAGPQPQTNISVQDAGARAGASGLGRRPGS